MKRLLFLIFLLPLMVLGQVNYSTIKTMYYVRTITGHGAVPAASKFKYANDIIYNSTDSAGYRRINGVVVQAYTIYPYSVGAIRLVPTVVKTSTATVPTVRSQYYVKTSLIPGNIPPTNNFTSSIVRCWNADSTLWQKWNGQSKRQYVCYTFSPRVDPVVPPLCTYTYSAWSTCAENNTQTRTVISSLPAGCIEGIPILTQSCTYIPSQPPTLATRVYVSTAGSDSYTLSQAHNPLTPFNSIAKVNTLTLSANDTIFFKGGETFTGTITPQRNNLNYTSYGTGNALISGFTTITGWTNEGSGIYSKTATSPLSVTVNGVMLPKGTFPNTGFLTIDSYSTTVSITDAALNSSVQNWTGAEVLIRKGRWTYEKGLVTNHSGTTVTYSGGEMNARVGYGYFFQNDLKCLTEAGDWAYLSGKLYMYFGANNPDSYTVKASNVNNLLLASSKNYINASNLTFEGANVATIQLTSSNYASIKNCTINFAGKDAVNLSNSDNATVDNVTINRSNDNAIYAGYGSDYLNAKNCTIKNTGLYPGMGLLYFGILSYGANTTIEYNQIDSVGYCGVLFDNNNALIRNNFISNFCLTRDDGGGIYTYIGTDATVYTNRIVSDNIVINGLGAPLGTDDENWSPTVGVYLDDASCNVTITGNTMYNCALQGIYLHNSYDNIVRNNTCYNNPEQLHIESDNAGLTTDNNIIRSNKFISKGATQLCFNSFTLGATVVGMFTSDSNYLARPIDDVLTTKARVNGWGGTATFRTLANWRTYTGGDAASHGSPFAVSTVNNILFDYATTTAKVVTIPSGTWKDLDGNIVTSLTLQPYTSIILLKQ